MTAPHPVLPSADLEAMLAASPGGLHVLDVRPRAAFEAGHVPGSIHCPVHDLSRREADLPPRVSRIVVVGEPGRRTDAAVAFLRLTGFVAVASLEGGFAGWRGPVAAGPAPPRS